ncbi:hypothetical protein [Egbenema bharatensis]|uniref:hypothetical protein n=1 Tax=Egbenema bharatensis TaxID=3463334 RepID=UPI003A86AA4B
MNGSDYESLGRLKSLPMVIPPPSSLLKLLEPLSPEQKADVLTVRSQILSFDERMAEVGRTTTTQYGLHKDRNEIEKTHQCAEVIPLYPGVYRPRLMLLLPHPRRKFGGPGRTYLPEPVKGLAWAQVWQFPSSAEPTEPELFFYLGKTRSRYSKRYTLPEYAELYQSLTGSDRLSKSVEDIVQLALEEWQQSIAVEPAVVFYAEGHSEVREP